VAQLYADEQFPYPVVKVLRDLGHDVLTVQESGKAELRIPDDQILSFATQEGRAVLTLNRVDFFKLHRQSSDHAGIIACTDDRNWEALANRIHTALIETQKLHGIVIRINRPQQ
jgi:predicted nuclease of predicted toxin-antitoxin system